MVIWTGMLVLYFLWLASKAIFPVEILRFRNRMGAIIFVIAREKKQGDEVDEFVDAVRAEVLADGL